MHVVDSSILGLFHLVASSSQGLLHLREGPAVSAQSTMLAGISKEVQEDSAH